MWESKAFNASHWNSYVLQVYNKCKLSSDELYLSNTQLYSSEMCSLHLTHPSAPSAADIAAPGSSWGFGLKGLTSVMDTSCQSRDSNPQPWVTSCFKSSTLSIRPRLPNLTYPLYALVTLCRNSARWTKSVLRPVDVYHCCPESLM